MKTKAPRDLVPKISFSKTPAGDIERSLGPWLDSVQREASTIITKYFPRYVPEDHRGDFLLYVSGVLSWPPLAVRESPRPPKRVREAAMVFLVAQDLRNDLTAGKTASAVVHAAELGVRAERLNLARHVELSGGVSTRASHASKVRWSKTKETAAEREAKYVRWEKADVDLAKRVPSGRERSRRISNREKKRGVPGSSFGNVQKILYDFRKGLPRS